MVKQVACTFVAAVVLSLPFPVVSAFGAHAGHRRRAHVTHRARHTHKAVRHKTRRRRHHKPGAAVRGGGPRVADIMSAAVLLGDNWVEPQSDALHSGEAEAFDLRAGATGVARLAHVYLGVANTASTVVVGLYSSAYGHPGVLLSTGTASPATGGAWMAVPIAPIEVLAGKTYWLAILGKGGMLRYRDRSEGSCPSQTSAQTTLGALPAYWKTGVVYGDCPPSAYVTVGASAPPAQPLEPVAPAPPLETTPQEPAPPTAPANVVLPSISGSATEGQELSASNGSWWGSPTSYAYQWKDCNASGEGCSSISGATSASYRLVAGDVGHTVRVAVTASNAGGSTSASSSQTGMVGAASVPELMLGSSSLQPNGDSSSAGSAEAFQFTAAATGTVHSFSLYVTSGTTAKSILVGLYSNTSGNPATLLTSATIVSPTSGAWNAVEVSTPVSVKSGGLYWLAALTPTGTLGMRDVSSGGGPTQSSASSSLSTLPYSWSSGESWANSPASFYASSAIVGSPPAAPTNTVLPSISGSPQEGQTLTASIGTWTGSPTGYTYQWQDCGVSGESCLAVSGATESRYKLTASDVGSAVRVEVTATNAGGSDSATSASTVPATARPPVASFTYSPASPVSGQPVSFNAASSSCFAGPCTYEWSDDGSPIRPILPLWPLGSGQELSYTFSTAGTKYVRLVVTDTEGQVATVEHNVVVEAEEAAPPAAPVNTASPAISGSAVEGQSLSASTGTWSGSPTSYAYQWQDCNTAGEACSSISGATKSSYKLTVGDVGHTARVTVTATNAGGSTPASSAATATVAAESPAAPVDTVLPAISGSAVEGQTLSASKGTWSGTPTSYAYQWQDCNTAGEGCSSIAGAGAASYVPAAGDVGRTLRVVVTATNAGGSTPATSSQTATVAKASSEGGKAVNPELGARKCFENPETEGTTKIEECGYAGENNTGPEPGTCCTVETGNKTLSAGTKLEGKEVRGTITIAGNNVTLRDDKIIGKAGCTGTEKGWTVCGGEHPAIKVEGENATIEHSLVEGESPKGTGLVTECIDSYTRTTTVRYSHWTNCDGAKFDGGGTIEKDFCVDNAEFLYSSSEPEHYECTNDDCKPGLLIEKENTFFNVHEQTAAIFTQGTTESCSEQRIEKNFLAGGGWVYYGEDSGSFAGLGPEYFTNNRIAFATCASGKEKVTKSSEGEFVGEGHVVCQEQTPWSGHMVQWTPQTPGGTGYFPQGGSYNGICLDLIKSSHDEGNFRDNNGVEVC